MIQSRRLNFVNPSTSSYCQSNMLFLGNCNSAFDGQRSSMFNMEETTKKRPFFSSPEDYFDDDYYEEQLPEKKRRLTPEQVDMLEKSFEEENKLEPERKSQLAKKLGLQPRQVAVWFQNRRARWKTKQIERDYDLLKASYDSLLSDFDKIVKENEKLKSEAASLSNMLQAQDATGAMVRAQESEGLIQATADTSAFQLNVKAEDRLSSGTAGSAVVDEDSPQLLDSGNSFFQSGDYAGCVIPADGIQSEEDGGSDDGRAYFSDVFVTAGQQQHEVEESLPWWMWS